MAYKYPPLSDSRFSVNYKSNIKVLTRSDSGDPKTGFCSSLTAKIDAVNFDAVARDVCYDRIACLCSVDAFFPASNGTYYFIEFKNTTEQELDKIEFNNHRPIDYRKKPPTPVACCAIEYSLRKKAIDSLALSSLTVLQDVPGKQIMDNAEFICVYQVDVSELLDGLPFSGKMAGALGLPTSGGAKTRIKWGLDDLKKSGFYREVYTMNENEFVAWAPSHLK